MRLCRYMDNYAITIRYQQTVRHFEVGEYAHCHPDKCKYRVFENGAYVASFEPEEQSFLGTCQNAGGLDEALINLLADEIEAQFPHALPKYFDSNDKETTL